MKTKDFLPVLLLLALLQACVTSGEKQQSPDKAAQYNAQLGINYMNQRGDLEQARIKLEKALEQDDGNALAHAGYAQLQSVVGDKKKAEVHYRRAIALEPLNADHHNAYGVFLCGEGKTGQALEEFDAAVDNLYYKTPELALNNAAVCLTDSGDNARAEDYLVRAVKANPKYSPALLNLADLNLGAGRMELAGAYYERYTQLSQETPRSLWIGYQIMRASGDLERARQLSDTLLSQYPNSKQAGELLTSTVND
ncbi:MAG: type IV pilus biogenesis/stability protein PilW [Gammaproteobacteria bacterium]|nr:type IV pilus biogenesis/stability protein PilW [Gammaproteobacteria bacterium]